MRNLRNTPNVPTLEERARKKIAATFPEVAQANRIPRTRQGLFAFSVTPADRPGYILVTQQMHDKFVGAARIVHMSPKEWLTIREEIMLSTFRLACAKTYAVQQLHIPEEEMFCREKDENKFVFGHKHGNVVVELKNDVPVSVKLVSA